MTSVPQGLESVLRVGPFLRPDPRRVITDLLVPGDTVPNHPSRAAVILKRVLALEEGLVEAVYADIVERFGRRHRNLPAKFADNFEAIKHRLPPDQKISPVRALLIGAYFTHEFSVEGAALTNPSLVAAPDQGGLNPGELRFLMSVRCVGEGHVSCIGFRSGVLGPGTQVRVDEPSGFVTHAMPERTTYPRQVLDHDTELGEDEEVLTYVLHHLPDEVTDADLLLIAGTVPSRLLMRADALPTIYRFQQIAASCYTIEFPENTRVDERVLWPSTVLEQRGMEDARFVRVTDDDGECHYQATYTAFDGSNAASNVLLTKDFRRFQILSLSGTAARSKGMALFPRAIDGRRYAICRPDLESLSLTSSQDGIVWDEPVHIRTPFREWELLQNGNCGSPIETDEGWLLLIHGVGPMREYRLGALLLDLEQPQVIRGELAEPLLCLQPGQGDGYVPNAIYSCGGLLHDGNLFIPYGFADTAIGFAAVPVADLLGRMLGKSGG